MKGLLTDTLTGKANIHNKSTKVFCKLPTDIDIIPLSSQTEKKFPGDIYFLSQPLANNFQKAKILVCLIRIQFISLHIIYDHFDDTLVMIEMDIVWPSVWITCRKS